MKTEEKEIKYLAALGKFSKFGPARLKKIAAFFDSAKQAFCASASELIEAGIEENIAAEFLAIRPEINPDKLSEQLEKEDIKIMIIDDDHYPQRLKTIYNAPQLLYYKGTAISEELVLAVVGTRKYSAYGEMVIDDVLPQLIMNGITIASGLALGIDSLAHNKTISMDGRTVAVLGSGLDKQSIYPGSNRYLADKIIANGGQIISEFPLGTPPLKHNFPQRNRLVSGMSLGTLVVEAAEKSGALITARYALEQNREVFAVPGNIFSPVSMGPNNLIKQGAIPAACAADIISALDLLRVSNYINNKKILPTTGEEKIILSFLNFEPLHINELAKLSSMPITSLNSNLVVMEMKGMVKNIGNMEYIAAI